MPTSNAFNVLSEIPSSSQTVCQPTAPLSELNTISHCNDDSICSLTDVATPMLSNESKTGLTSEFIYRSKGLHIANLNIRHLLPKIDEIGIAMSEENGPDIIGICETFLNPSISCNQVTINGFSHIRKDRSDTQDKSGGGLILYFRNSITCKRSPEIEISNIETIWSEISMPNSKPFLICTAYRPPNATSDWIDKLEAELSVAQSSGLELILMGDINIDYRSCSNTKWLQLIQLFDLTQLVTDFTRITPLTATIIDHIYTSNPENIIDCFVPSYAISDHFPVCFSRKVNSKVAKTNHISTTYRCFKHFNESSFLDDLGSGLESFEASQSHVDDDFTKWFSVIQNHLDRHAPLKTRRVKSKRMPEWFTPDIRDARKLRDHYKRSKNWSKFKEYRNKTRNLIRAAKKAHFSESIAFQKDTRKIWKHFRSLNNKANSAQNTLPDEILINDQTYTDSKDIAFKLNEFFASVCDQFSFGNDPADHPDLNKLKTYIESKVPSHVNFTVPYITPEEVNAFLHALDPTKATGVDGLGPRILKMAANILSPSIASLINKSIQTASFPSHLKTAKIFPIHKGGSKSDPTNYRPISILPTISKIFEKHINKHLMGFLNKYDLIHKNQSGFRPKHSCQTALIKLIDQWMSCIDKGDIVGTLFLDFRKAFDLIDHSILIKKLSIYKFRDSTLKLFASYVMDRHQVMESNTGTSRPAHIKSGVPQGSILGPTLVLMFLNDLHLYMKHCDSDYYADDATVHTHGSTPNVIESKLQQDGNNTKLWCKQNKMEINYDKYMYDRRDTTKNKKHSTFKHLH